MEFDLFIKLFVLHQGKRPTAKELLKNDLIPRKAEDIALDELLQSALTNKQSTKFTKIIKSVFDQKVLPKDDASYDEVACKVKHQAGHMGL